MKFNNLKDILTKFSNENTCREFLIQQRWNGKPICPKCGCETIYRIEENKRLKCGHCHYKFSVTVGTVFENSKIKLSTWFAAIYIATAHKKGISSIQLHKDLGISQKTAWFLLHRIREMLKADAPNMLSNIVEVDETFIGGRNKNRHANKRIENSQGRSLKDKTPVFGAIQRFGKVKAIVVPNTKAKTLKPIIEKLVKNGSIMVSDEWKGYSTLSSNFNHLVIKHNEGEYVKSICTY
jgi:transposase-like protein